MNESQGYIFFNGRAKYLKSNSIISLDSVLNPTSQIRFESFPDKDVIFRGYDPYFYWYSFSIANNSGVKREIILLFGGKGVRTAELWQQNRNLFSSLGKTGYKYSFDSRLYPFTSYYYPISLPPHSTNSFYLNVDESHAYKTVTLVLFEPRKLEKIKSRFYYVFGIITGVLLLFALLNIYLYFSLNESIHIWYSLYVLFSLFFLIKHEGLDMQFFGMDSELAYRSSSMGGIVAISSGFLIQVIQLFFSNIPERSLLSHALSFVKWSLWLSGIASLIVFLIQPANTVELIVFEWANKSVLAAICVILTSCIYSIVQGYKPAWILLCGQVVFLAGGLVRTLFIGNLSYVIPPAPFELGLLVEVVIISFGLMYRYNLFKKEKDRLAEQLKVHETNLTSQILTTQENERKRIAEDLHDELGGNLAAIKMALQSVELPEPQGGTIRELIDNASVNARDIAHNLMPPDFERTRLSDMLKAYYNGKHQRIKYASIIIPRISLQHLINKMS